MRVGINRDPVDALDMPFASRLADGHVHADRTALALAVDCHFTLGAQVAGQRKPQTDRTFDRADLRYIAILQISRLEETGQFFVSACGFHRLLAGVIEEEISVMLSKDAFESVIGE